MNLKTVLVFALIVVATTAKPAPKKRGREARTLGLITAGANALGSGVGALGSAAATAVGAVAAAKPLILLGLGKYALLNYLSKQNANAGGYVYTAGSTSTTYDDGYYYVDEAPATFVSSDTSFTPYVEQYVEEPVIFPEQPVIIANNGW